MSKIKRHLNILVPRLVDEDNRNAQNLNAKALLSRFKSTNINWHTFNYNAPDPAVESRNNVRCHQLIHSRFWTWHAFLKYQGKYDAIFYPGNEDFDVKGLKWRLRLGRMIPVISTLEGLPGDSLREEYLSVKSGHAVKCFRPRTGSNYTACFDKIRNYSNLNIAISPYLKRMGEHLYESDFSVLPLGVNARIFNTEGRISYPKIPLVVGAGTLYDVKRPEIFVHMASLFPYAQFEWYGDGVLRNKLIAQTKSMGIKNLSFPGALSAKEMANRFKVASLFVLPSLSEGVPKVTQEAAACGLPIVLFGFYEAPSVISGQNGYVVWNDEELYEAVSKLISAPYLLVKMGRIAKSMADEWSWDQIAPQWEKTVLQYLKPERKMRVS